MKTLFLFEDAVGAHFFELEGDYSHLHDVYINAEVPEGTPYSASDYENLQNALAELVYEVVEPEEGEEVTEDDGVISVDYKFDELEMPTKDWDHFVRCGSLE